MYMTCGITFKELLEVMQDEVIMFCYSFISFVFFLVTQSW